MTPTATTAHPAHSPNGTAATTGGSDRPMDANTAMLETILSDLTTYRYVTQVPVSPSLARRIIDLNSVRNRNHRPTRSARYARDIKAGNWREKTGQTVKIATDGSVVDGLHRMHAVASGDRTILFDLCIGVPPENMPVIDAGMPHTAADVIKMSGGDGADKGTAAIVRWVWAWERDAPMGIGGVVTPNPLEIQERFLEDRDVFTAATARAKDAVKRRLCAASPVGTAYVLFHGMGSPTVCHDFFDAFISGIWDGQKETDAVYRLRERMRTRHTDRLTPAHQMALIIRAWNFYNTFAKDGDRVPCYKLQIAREGKLGNANFPRPIKARVF